MSRSYEAVLEQVLPLLGPQDILSCSSACKRINEYIIRSASIQLILRRYLYQIPPEDSEIHGGKTENRSSRDELDDLISTQFHISHLRAKKFTFDLPPGHFILGAAQGYIITCATSSTRADQGKWELCRIWSQDGTFKTLFVSFRPIVGSHTPLSIEDDVIMAIERVNDNTTRLHMFHLHDGDEWAVHHSFEYFERRTAFRESLIPAKGLLGRRICWTYKGKVQIHDWITGFHLGDIHNTLHNCRKFDICWAGPTLLLGLGLTADLGNFLLIYEIKKLDPRKPVQPTVVLGLPGTHPKPLSSYIHNSLQARGHDLDSLRAFSYALSEGSLLATGNIILRHWSHLRDSTDPHCHIILPVHRLQKLLVKFQAPSTDDTISLDVPHTSLGNYRFLKPDEWFSQTFMYIAPSNYGLSSAYGSKVISAEFSSDYTLKVVLYDFNPRLARCCKPDRPLGGCLESDLEDQQELDSNKDHTPTHLFKYKLVDPTHERIEHVRSEGHFSTTVVTDALEEFFDGTRLITLRRDDRSSTVDIFDFSGK